MTGPRRAGTGGAPGYDLDMRCLPAAARTAAVVVLLGALAALAALPAAGAPAKGRAAARGPAAPACTARQLHADIESSSGAAGTVVLRIGIRNTGAACTLAGHPRLQLGRGAAALPTRTVHGGMPLLETVADPVELADGGRAFLLVAYRDRPVGATRDTALSGSPSCPAATHIDMRVDGWRRVLRVAVRTAPCDGGLLRISPFLHGARSPVPATTTTTASAGGPATGSPRAGTASGVSYPGDL